MCSNFEFLGLRLKKKDIESKIGSKVIKPILRMYGYNMPSSKNDFDLEIYMRRKLTELFDNHANGLTLSEDKHKFIDQFREDWSYLWLLHRTFFMIEKGKKYKLAIITLICLLNNRLYFRERGHWWYRLGMNLKHLKMKDEVF